MIGHRLSVIGDRWFVAKSWLARCPLPQPVRECAQSIGKRDQVQQFNPIRIEFRQRIEEVVRLNRGTVGHAEVEPASCPGAERIPFGNVQLD